MVLPVFATRNGRTSEKNIYNEKTWSVHQVGEQAVQTKFLTLTLIYFDAIRGQ